MLVQRPVVPHEQLQRRVQRAHVVCAAQPGGLVGGQAVATVRIAGSHNEDIGRNSLEITRITREPGREMSVLRVMHMISCPVIILEIKYN